MLRTNLSTRPFYNVARGARDRRRPVATLVALATAYNVVELARLTTQQRSLSADAVSAETEAGRLTREAAQVRVPHRPDRDRLGGGRAPGKPTRSSTAGRSRGRRSSRSSSRRCPPTCASPPSSRAASTDGTFAVSVAVQSRRIEAVDAFIEALEALGTFKNVLPTEEQTTEDGLIEAVLDGQYFPEAPAAAATSTEGEPAPEQRTRRGQPECSPMSEMVSPLVARIASENKRVLVMLLVGVGVNVLAVRVRRLPAVPAGGQRLRSQRLGGAGAGRRPRRRTARPPAHWPARTAR